MSSVPFAKPPLDFASQFKRLSDRCLDSDKSELGELMLTTSYYRLRRYPRPAIWKSSTIWSHSVAARTERIILHTSVKRAGLETEVSMPALFKPNEPRR